MKRLTKISSLLLFLLASAWSTAVGQQNQQPPFNAEQALKASDIVAGKQISLWVLNSSVTDRWFTREDNLNKKRSSVFSDYCIFTVENADHGQGFVLKRKVDGKYIQKSTNGIQWSENKSDAVTLSATHPGENFNYTDDYLNEAPAWDPNYEKFLVRFTETGTSNFLNGNDPTGFATGIGSWSAFLIQEYNISNVIKEYVNNYISSPDNCVGGLTISDKETLKGMPTATEEDFTAIKNFISAHQIEFNVNKAYLLKTPGRTQKNYMTMNADFLTGTDYDAQNASLVWKFEGDATSGYIMSNQGRYAQQPSGVSKKAPSTDKKEEASKFQLNKIDNQIGRWSIKPENEALHLDLSYNIVGWNSGEASEWYLIEAPTIEAEITEAGYATVNYPFAVEIPTGISAYIGTANVQDKVFTLKKIENSIIPANTPIVIQGDPKKYNLNILADNTENPIAGNDLSGIYLSQEIDAMTNAYILGNGNNGIGFYQMSSDDRTLTANKAYLELSASLSNIRSIVIGGPTTGIEETTDKNTNTVEYYDLQGRRVSNPVKGIYITKNGKKVLFNN